MWACSVRLLPPCRLLPQPVRGVTPAPRIRHGAWVRTPTSADHAFSPAQRHTCLTTDQRLGCYEISANHMEPRPHGPFSDHVLFRSLLKKKRDRRALPSSHREERLPLCPRPLPAPPPPLGQLGLCHRQADKQEKSLTRLLLYGEQRASQGNCENQEERSESRRPSGGGRGGRLLAGKERVFGQVTGPLAGGTTVHDRVCHF